MGYTTNFYGEFILDRGLSDNHQDYLTRFSEVRHMQRNVKVLENFEDRIRQKAQLPLGLEGEFFVGSKHPNGQEKDSSVINFNIPPITQPGLWCNWTPTTCGQCIIWNGSEKFYNYVEWLNYIINNFLIPWNYILNGKVEFQGESPDDFGIIEVKNNLVTLIEGKRIFKEKQENITSTIEISLSEKEILFVKEKSQELGITEEEVLLLALKLLINVDNESE